MEERRGVYRVLVRKPVEKRQYGSPRHSWENNIEMDFQEVGCGRWAGSICLRIGSDCGHL